MSVVKSVGRVLGRCGLCALLVASVGTLSVEAAADSASEEDAHAAFAGMVGKLEKAVAGAKKQAGVSEGELRKLAKRAETASWRVAAARQRFDQYQTEMASTKEPEKLDQLKGKLANEVRLLKTDADKLAQMVTRSKELRAKNVELSDVLRSLKDDVAIEADRFDESDKTQKKAMQLIADADWALNKLDEVNSALESELENPAGETLGKTQVE